MSRFLTPLRVQLIDEIDQANMAGGDGQRSSWRLLDELRYESDLLGTVIEVPAGFDTDFASIPRSPLTARYMGMAFKASVLHDWGYRIKSLSKDEADSVFKEAMLVDRLPCAEAFYLAVRAFGMTSYDPKWQGWPDQGT